MQFIKIGTFLINLDNVTRIQKVDGQRVEFEMNVSDYGEEPFNFCFIYTDTIGYPQALAAYEFLCKGAMTFDIPDAGKRAIGDTGDGGSVPRFRLQYIGGTDLAREGFNGEDYKIVTGSGVFVAFARDEVSAYDILADKHENYSLEVNLPATPQADSVAATPRIQPFTQSVDDSEGTGLSISERREMQPVDYVMLGNGDEIEIRSEDVPHILATETRILREQNVRLQQELDEKQNFLMKYAATVQIQAARVKELERELDKARQRVSELEGQNKAMHNVIQHVAKTASDAIPKGVKEFTQAEKALRYIVSSIQNGSTG